MPTGTPIIYEPEDVRSRLVGKGLGDFFSQWMMGKTELEKEDRLLKFRREMEEKRRGFELDKQKIDIEARKELAIMAHGFDKELKSIMQNYDMEKIEHQALQNANQRIRVAEAEGKIDKENRAAALQQEYRNQKNLLLYRIAGSKDLATHEYLLSEQGKQTLSKYQEEQIKLGEKELETKKHITYVGEAGETARQRERLGVMERIAKMEQDAATAREALRITFKQSDDADEVAREAIQQISGLYKEYMKYEGDEKTQAALRDSINSIASVAEQFGVSVPRILEELDEEKESGLGAWLRKVLKGAMGGPTMWPDLGDMLFPESESPPPPAGSDKIVWD